jgi:hypothetical protein
MAAMLPQFCGVPRVSFGCSGRVGKLRKRHHLVLHGAGQCPHGAIAFISRDDPVERAPWQEIHELREYRLAGVHGRALPAGSSGKANSNSNPSRQ